MLFYNIYKAKLAPYLLKTFPFVGYLYKEEIDEPLTEIPKYTKNQNFVKLGISFDVKIHFEKKSFI